MTSWRETDCLKWSACSSRSSSAWRRKPHHQPDTALLTLPQQVSNKPLLYLMGTQYTDPKCTKHNQPFYYCYMIQYSFINQLILVGHLGGMLGWVFVTLNRFASCKYLFGLIVLVKMNAGVQPARFYNLGERYALLCVFQVVSRILGGVLHLFPTFS